MKNRIAAVVLVILCALALAAPSATAAAPAEAVTTVTAQVPAGNGTSNFYLKGDCHVGRIGGVDMWFTNYDSGANQIYHVAWKRSGVAWSVKGIYIDGVYKGKGSDMFISIPGHGAHTVRVDVGYTGTYGTYGSCSDRT
jgi:hypothetical protein